MKKVFFLFVILIAFVACKKETTTSIVFDLQNFSGTTPMGRGYIIDSNDYKFLFSNFEWVDANSNVTKIKDLFLLSKNNNTIVFNKPKDDFKTIRFYLGIDKSTNNTLPISYPASNPLSVESGLYWDMLKYRFIIVEGKIDNSLAKNQTPTMPFSMHLGADTLYTPITTNIIPQPNSTLHVNIDLSKLFVLDEPVFAIKNFSNHSEAAQLEDAISIKNNLLSGIKFSVTFNK